MGARFATSGGRQGWLRTLLTAVGVALGVAVLLLAAAVPEIVRSNDSRSEARSGGFNAGSAERTEYSVLGKDANNRWSGYELYGRLLQAEGSSPATPPGVDRIPAPGEMVVSPALKKVLDSPRGEQLRERLDAKVVGTIGDEGLLGPYELAFYKGADDLTVSGGAIRVNKFGSPLEEEPMDPVLVLLVVVACAVLVMPVAIFIATAVRFGGEQRDSRLAALRLVGADIATTRRMAAGETLVGALVGLLLGGWFFLLGRAFIGNVELFRISVFPQDVTPGFYLGLLIVIGVPVTAVAVTIFALRGVAIEPLGLVRKSEQRKRRLWWRLLPPAGGAALLLPLAGSLDGDGGGAVDEFRISSGVVLLLSGIVLLLPWLVERIVARLRGGPVSWQLATRRLQLSSGNATRAISGITVAVAGAIALQLLFSVVEAREESDRAADRSRSFVDIYGPHATFADTEELTAQLRRTPGVRSANGYLLSWVEAKGIEDGVGVTVGSCKTLRAVARIGECRDGDSFLVRTPKRVIEERGGGGAPPPERGTPLMLDKAPDEGSKSKYVWKVPRSARTVLAKELPNGATLDGLLVTPSVLSEGRLDTPSYQGEVVMDRSEKGLEELRTTVFHADPSYTLWENADRETAEQVGALKNAVLAASMAVLLLIGASMAVSMLEQLRERKRQLSVLVAFGTRRSTLGASVLWQTTVTVVLGIGMAVFFGLGLGWALLRMLGDAQADWLVFLPSAAAGAGVIALVTLVSLPFLWRMMRPDGLRTE